MKNPLNDSEFLLELDKNREKEIYARITSLTWDESPIEYIEGQVAGGNISLDGSSALQRTCSLTLVAENVNINNYYWGLNTKFKLEIGLANKINSEYPSIIWFPQGIFVFTTFNTSQSTNNYSISISGKDKMCLLNGDISGSLNASIDFGIEEYYDKENETITYTPIPIKTIIKNAVHIYGNEPLHNIIINDIDDFGYELLDYKGDTPLYLFKNITSDTYINMTLNQEQSCFWEDEKGNWTDSYEDKDGKIIKKMVSNIPEYNSQVNIALAKQGTSIKLKKDSKNIYTVCKIEKGQTVGYRATDLTYAGELISKVGESLTSILDKIKNMLGAFEYFYDVNGHFIFQKKKIYAQGKYSSLINTNEGMYVEAAAYSSALAYTFYDSKYFTALSHNPTLNNLKNDFSIWGIRKSISGADLPVHMRYALDYKPKKYVSIKDGTEYTSTDYDWRELIYQMALDYFSYSEDDDFISKVAAANPETYPTGYTGYEQYYTDIQGFWRQLYNPVRIPVTKDTEPDPEVYYYIYNTSNQKYELQDFNNITQIKTPIVDNNTTYYDAHGNPYINPTGNNAIFIFNPENEYYIKNKEDKLIPFNIYEFKPVALQCVYQEDGASFNITTGWNNNVTDNPAILNFWFDFLGEGSELEKYMVPNIGSRVKAINDKDVNAIYFKATPDVLFVTDEDYVNTLNSGYTYIRINNNLNNLFNISAQGKSAYDTMEQLLYENTYCIESINLTSIPIFYLKPNVRIAIKDEKSNINGEYLISKISFSLVYNGTMQITATKAIDDLY